MLLNRLNTRISQRTLRQLDLERGSLDTIVKKLKARLTLAVKVHMAY